MFYVNTVARVISLMFFMSCHVTSIHVNQLDKKNQAPRAYDLLSFRKASMFFLSCEVYII